MKEGEPILSVSIHADYPTRKAVLQNVEFELRGGEIFGLVGQSGSGKSTLGLAVLGLLGWKGGEARGSIRFRGRELIGASESELRSLRGREISFVPQSALSSLNPALRLRSQFREVWCAHKRGSMDAGELKGLLESVSLPRDAGFLEKYPAELSVGQGQRVLIAMALVHRPAVIVADEPTSALDVITQMEILALFRRLNKEAGSAILFISHDLSAVGAVCDRIGVLREGRMVETGEARQVLCAPLHEYTRRLVDSIPRPAWSGEAG